MANELDQLEKVQGIIFTNEGIFICRAKLLYTLADGTTGITNDWGPMLTGQSVTMNPGDRGLPAGTVFQLYIDIVAGNDRTGGVNFHYGPERDVYAKFSITGTTLFSDVHYNGIGPA